MYTPPILETAPFSVSTSQSLAAELGLLAGTPASAAWPTANLAIFVPLYVPVGFVAPQIYWNNGATVTGSTSVECAVYNEAGTVKLITSGVVTQVNASSPQAVTIAGGYFLPRGRYWMGLICGNNTSTFSRYTASAAATLIGTLLGVSEQTLGGTALPATITFGPAANSYIPDMGLSRSALAI